MVRAETTENDLMRRLRPVIDLLERHRLVDAILSQQHAPRQDLVASLTHRQQQTELRNKLKSLHAADIAHLIEILPPEQRSVVWRQVPDELGGDVLWELPEGVAEGLLEITSRDRLITMCRYLPPDDLAQIADRIPSDVLEEVSRSLSAGERSWLQTSIAYPEDSVGHLMSSDIVVVEATQNVKQALKVLRSRAVLPDQTDKLFVVDSRHRLKGELPLQALLLHRLRTPIAEIMSPQVLSFSVSQPVAAAAGAFDRYDLVSAPVLDGKGKLVGRLTVDTVLDFVREEAERDALKREGLRGDEDLSAPIWNSARERWLWLCINLFTAFAASRVISVFEGTIEHLVALATLMPIVASIAGNTGNQTIALFIRGLALDKITSGNVAYLALKEIRVSLINGAVWGGVMGLIAAGIYQSMSLGLVMATATLLNMGVAAVVGFGVPLAMKRMGRDPALGSNVLLTFITDSMGFLIFLGLSTLFLLP